jgi:hypothetical protein
MELVLPKQRRELCNLAAQSRAEHIVKNSRATLRNVNETKESIVYEVIVCNEDASTLLRDFPMPFYVKKIDIVSTGHNLYLFRKHRRLPSSEHVLYKNVYWLAKSTERYAKYVL